MKKSELRNLVRECLEEGRARKDRKTRGWQYQDVLDDPLNTPVKYRGEFKMGTRPLKNQYTTTRPSGVKRNPSDGYAYPRAERGEFSIMDKAAKRLKETEVATPRFPKLPPKKYNTQPPRTGLKPRPDDQFAVKKNSVMGNIEKVKRGLKSEAGPARLNRRKGEHYQDYGVDPLTTPLKDRTTYRKHPEDAKKITTFIKYTDPTKRYAGNKTVVGRKKGSHYYSPDNSSTTTKKKLGEAGPARKDRKTRGLQKKDVTHDPLVTTTLQQRKRFMDGRNMFATKKSRNLIRQEPMSTSIERPSGSNPKADTRHAFIRKHGSYKKIGEADSHGNQLMSSTELASVRNAVSNFERLYTKYIKQEPSQAAMFRKDIAKVKTFVSVKTYDKLSDKINDMDTAPAEDFYVMLPTNLQNKIEF